MSENISWTESGIVEMPTWYGPNERPLFGWLTFPEERRVLGAVVICSPVCEEGRAAHRTMRELARSLAQDGFLSLRFDYDGTGDSVGSYNDPEWVDRWVISVEHSIQFLRRIGADNIALVGMRLGATIAAVAAARSSEYIRSLVLWDPCRSGKNFLREQALLHRTVFDASFSGEEGSIETPGYVFGPKAVEGLNSLRLDDVLTLDATSTTVSVLFRDDRAHSTELDNRFRAAGFQVGVARGQDNIVDVTPVVAKVPYGTLNEVTRLLGVKGGGPARLEPVLMHGLDAAVHQTARFMTQWGTVTEELVAVGRASLFGIETRPDRDSATTVVFLNALTECHIGPARMWPALAREWAGRGAVSGLRFDVGGIGDSPDVNGRPRDRILLPGAIDDINDVVDREHGEGRAAVLIGLSSGGYAALEGALQKSIAGVVAINPAIDALGLTYTLTDRVNFDARRKAIRKWPSPLARYAIEHHRIATALWFVLQQLWPLYAPMAVVAKIVRNGAHVLMVLADVDRLPFDRNWYWRLRSGMLRRSGRYSRIDPPSLDHGLLIAGGRSRLIDGLTRYILATYGARSIGADTARACLTNGSEFG